MKLMLTCLFVTMCCLPTQQAAAQDLEHPGAYMTAITNAVSPMDKKYMAYNSAAAHGRRARKVEKLRQQVLEAISAARYKVIDIPYYKGDNSLRQSTIDYVDFIYKVYNDDYARLVNTEEIAERSFNEMEAYILIQETIDQKLKEAGKKLSLAEDAFAVKYNVNVIKEQSPLGEKLEVAAKLNHYVNKVYMVFFKSNWQDSKITEALNAEKLTEMEQGRNALIRYASEGIIALDTLKNFEGDAALAMKCREVLKFYKKEAENDLPKMTDFFLKKENFEKVKKAFNAKSESSRTQQDIDAYNKAVNEMNKASQAYNEINHNVNTGRSQMIDEWNKAEKEFADTHMPYYR